MSDITENDNIVSLQQRRKQAEAKARTKQSVMRAEVLNDVDQSIAAAIDRLKRHGLSNDEAHRFIVTHLNDIVVAYDMMGGPYD